MSSGSPARRLNSLTGIRFFAALAVLASHTAFVTRLPGWVATLHSHGRAGVCFFFILSGFILTFNYRDGFAARLNGRTLGRFARARFARIYPMNVLALVLVTPLVLHLMRTGQLLWLPERHVSTRALIGSWLAQLLLVQPYIKSLTWEYLWNVPAWSVACEAFFYLLFPFCIALMSRTLRTRGAVLRCAALLYAIEVAGFLLAVALLRRHGDGGQWRETLDLLAYKLPIARLWEFLIGCCMGILFLDHRPRFLATVGRRNTVLLVCLALVMANLVLNSRGEGTPSLLNWYVLYTPIFAVMILCLACGPTMLAPVLDHPLIIVLGEASYSLYLLHWMAILTLNARFNGQAPVWAAIAAMVICIVASVASWRFFETPARNWIRGGRAHRPAPLVPTDLLAS